MTAAPYDLEERIWITVGLSPETLRQLADYAENLGYALGGEGLDPGELAELILERVALRLAEAALDPEDDVHFDFDLEDDDPVTVH